ncbi:hypothetical protein [Halomarina ordinaria]|uniref:DUF8160 domain-containing protein n=1 Tax=Halomarina ordinaria TaxID=3033939 RepID=A0ABD5U514_9EURY|nr:hypothetical protein [Halomarina sp. PSRA2]
MTDRDERSNRLKRRFEREDPDSTPGREERGDASADTPTDDPATDTGDDRASIKERPSVLMYLPEDLRQELDIRFDELNARHKREHGEPLEKNRDYYPAVVEAGLEETTVEDVLDI